jgi:hypothetical protein
VFADAGANVTAVDLDAEGLARLEPRMRTVTLDVSDLAGVETMVAETAAATDGSTRCSRTPASPRAPASRSAESGRLENLDLATQKVSTRTSRASPSDARRRRPMKDAAWPHRRHLVGRRDPGGPTVGYAYWRPRRQSTTSSGTQRSSSRPTGSS